MRDGSKCAKPDEHRSSPIDERRTAHASKGVTALPQTPLHRSRAERRAAAAVAPRSAHCDTTIRVPNVGAGRLRIWWIVGAVLLAIAAGVTWRAASGRPQAPTGPMLGQRIADEGFGHVAVGSQTRDKANPPASGPHYPFSAPAGVYPNGLQSGFWVHSLEHGYIVLLYRPPASTAHLAEFDRMVKDFPKSKYGNVKLVIAAYPDMPHPYAVLAWDWRLQMESFNRATVLQFYKEHVDHGRENVQ